MYKRVHFFNHFHLGDIHETKEVVRWIVNNVPAEEYVYSHKNPKKIIGDIEGLNIVTETPEPPFDSGWRAVDGVLYVNTWYRTRPDIHDIYECSLQTTYHTMVDELSKLGIEFDGDMLDLIPKINYDKFKINAVREFLSKSLEQKRVFISNCRVLSGQSVNFAFAPIIFNLALKFKDVTFFVSNYGQVFSRLPNVFCTRDIIGLDENDLNENAYLAKHCPIIIGRSSGTHSFCYNTDNFLDKNKLMIDFTKDIRIGTFGLDGLVPARFVHSKDYGNVEKIISREIEGYPWKKQ